MSGETADLVRDLALFLCKFDNTIGRMLVYREPKSGTTSLGEIWDNEFDDVSDFLIPKPVLCGQLIVLRSSSDVKLCWPVFLDDARYERNALIFALGFVHAGTPAPDFCERYGMILRKMCAHLVLLEKESSLLSDASRHDDLTHTLSQVLRGLRERGTCAVAADAANTIHLQLPPRQRHGQSGPVNEQLVPVLVVEWEVEVVRRWDLALQKLLPWIDGTRTAAEVAAVAQVDRALATTGLGHLQVCGWIRMLDLFDVRDRYACTPRLHTLANDRVAREQLAARVGHPDAPEAPTWADVFRLYAACRPDERHAHGWRSVRMVRELHPAAAAMVDFRMLVYAGVLNGVLRRIDDGGVLQRERQV